MLFLTFTLIKIKTMGTMAFWATMSSGQSACDVSVSN